MILKNICLILQDKVIKNGWIQIQNRLIKDFGYMNAFNGNLKNHIIDLKGLKVLPGFIDCHTHGGYGVAFEDASKKAFSLYAKNILQEGVTRYCQGTVTQDIQDLIKSFQVYKDWLISENKNKQARSIGIHLEGPFISLEKRGAHPISLILKPSIKILKELIDASNNNIRIITYAPEQQEQGFTRFLKTQKIIPSAGHSNITMKQFEKEFLPIGVDHVTHLFNGMSGVNHQTPGLASGALANDKVLCEVISDGHHIKDSILKFIYKCKSKYNICLITDSMRAKGLPDGEYMLGELETEKKGLSVYVKNTNTLAGSVASYDHCYRHFKKVNNLDDIDMIYMTSINIAKQLNIFEKTGSISINKYADLVILNKNDEVVITMIEGQIGYQNKDIQI